MVAAVMKAIMVWKMCLWVIFRRVLIAVVALNSSPLTDVYVHHSLCEALCLSTNEPLESIHPTHGGS